MLRGNGRTIAALTLAAAALAAPAHAQTSEALLVDDDGAECPGAFATIGAALQAAAARDGQDTVRVCAGEYRENVRVSAGNPVRIVGADRDAVRITGASGTAGPIVLALGERLELVRLTVDGGRRMGGENQTVIGIRFHAASGAVDRVAVRGIQNEAGTSAGFGLVTTTAGGAAAHVVVEGAEITGFNRAGVFADGVGVRLELLRSVVMRERGANRQIPIGVQVSRGATGVVDQSEIGRVVSPYIRALAPAVIVLCPGRGTQITQNVIPRADSGVTVTDAAEVLVARNRTEDVHSPYGLVSSGGWLGSRGCPGALPVTSANTFLRNESDGSLYHGFTVAGEAENSAFGPRDNVVQQNRLVENGFNGITIDEAWDNHVLQNTVIGSGRSPSAPYFDEFNDGIHVFEGSDNLFEANAVSESFDVDCQDDAAPANRWERNAALTSAPVGLCGPAPDFSASSLGSPTDDGGEADRAEATASVDAIDPLDGP